MPTPPFHTKGRPEGDFYALAYVVGEYIPQKGEEAFYVLSWSPSESFTRFSFSTARLADGSPLAYHRGTDDLDTLEFSILRASEDERVPPYSWRLYPAEHIDESAFASDGVRDEYAEVPTRLCLILWCVRRYAWSNAQYPDGEHRFFRIAETPLPDPTRALRRTRRSNACWKSSMQTETYGEVTTKGTRISG